MACVEGQRADSTGTSHALVVSPAEVWWPQASMTPAAPCPFIDTAGAADACLPAARGHVQGTSLHTITHMTPCLPSCRPPQQRRPPYGAALSPKTALQSRAGAGWAAGRRTGAS
jgi:hypothetical protein